MPGPTAFNAYTGTEDTVSAVDAAEITPNDTTDFKVSRELLIGTAGDLHCIMASGTEITLPVPAGYNPLQIVRVFTDSTAADIFALY